MESDNRIVRRAQVVWGIVIALVVLLFAFAVWKSGRMAKTMSAAASSDEQEFSRSAVGSTAKFVAELTEVTTEGKITGRLLQKKTEEVYARTATVATVQSNEHTKIVMGKAADLMAGAVVHVTGTVQKDHAVAAEQIVILTGYVKVRER
jgi:hypothetical protein